MAIFYIYSLVCIYVYLIFIILYLDLLTEFMIFYCVFFNYLLLAFLVILILIF